MKKYIKSIISLVIIILMITLDFSLISIYLTGVVLNIVTVLTEYLYNKKEFCKKVYEEIDHIYTRNFINILIVVVCLLSFLVPISSLVIKNKEE